MEWQGIRKATVVFEREEGGWVRVERLLRASCLWRMWSRTSMTPRWWMVERNVARRMLVRRRAVSSALRVQGLLVEKTMLRGPAART